MRTNKSRAWRKIAAVFGLLLCLSLCAFPVSAGSSNDYEVQNHVSLDNIQALGVFDDWLSGKSGRNVTYDTATNSITFHFVSGDEGRSYKSSYFAFDEVFPFLLGGDHWCYYVGGGGSFFDNNGFSILLGSQETGGYAVLPRAYENVLVDSAQNATYQAAVAFSWFIPSDAVGSITFPYFGVYRVNDLNRSGIPLIGSSEPNFGSGSSTLAQQIFEPFSLASLVTYVRTQGFANGVTEGRLQGYQNGYEAGETAGLEEGYQNGYEAGETAGYSQGYTDGLNETDSVWTNLINAVISVPIQGFSGLLSFEVFGIEILPFVGSILTIFLVVWLLKLVL